LISEVFSSLTKSIIFTTLSTQEVNSTIKLTLLKHHKERGVRGHGKLHRQATQHHSLNHLVQFKISQEDKVALLYVAYVESQVHVWEEAFTVVLRLYFIIY
jgi:hypothetical protein